MTAMTATVSEATARQAVFDYASTDAERWTNELRQFGQLWRGFNEAHFEAALDEPHVQIGSPTSPKAQGSFTAVGGDGLRSLILIRRTLVDGTFNRGKVPAPGQTVRFFREGHDLKYRWRYLGDVLLHEMVHQWEVHSGTATATMHNVAFTAKCNEIGDQLGLPHVVTRRRKTDPVKLPIAAEWPINVRPPGYYGDLWAEISASAEAGDDWLTQFLALWEAGPPDKKPVAFERIRIDMASDGEAEPVAAANGDATSSLPELVRAERQRRQWSQDELARRADTHQSVVSKLENGRRVSDEQAARVLAALGIAAQA